MSENRTSSALQMASHALVVGAGLVYVFGFVIVSISDASYGIADFSLFRTKVVAVGILFALLLAIPVMLTFRMFGIFGLTTQYANLFAPAVTEQNYTYHLIDVALNIPFACAGMTWLLLFLFTSFSGWKPIGFGLFLLTVIMLAMIGVWTRGRFDRHPRFFVAISFLACVALGTILLKYADRAFLWMVAWLTVISVLTLIVSRTLRDPEKLRTIQWERLFLIAMPLIFGLYAFGIYPKIRHEFGGGAPVPVILHLTKKLAVFESSEVSVSLIDETEQGYYVVRGSDKALFVARNLVESVEFVKPQR
jgi:hypothetical protein